MLAKVRALLAYHIQAALTSLTALYRKPLATIMTILVIAVTLVLPALFWVMSDNMHKLTKQWNQSGRISLYLKSSLSPAAEAAFLLRIEKTAGVGQVVLKSAAEGLAELQQQEGMQDVMRYLPENPLPTVVEVTPEFDIKNSEKLEQLYSQLKSYPQVEFAKFDIQWVNRLQAILGFIDTLAHGLMALLALAVILIIGNTLRLAIHSRHEEIKILKLIGAKDSFIMRPFLYTGIWYGLAGAMFAVLLANIFVLSLTLVVNQLAGAYEMHYSMVGLSFRQIFLLICSASFLGWLGACLSVKKQLDHIEP